MFGKKATSIVFCGKGNTQIMTVKFTVRKETKLPSDEVLKQVTKMLEDRLIEDGEDVRAVLRVF